MARAAVLGSVSGAEFGDGHKNNETDRSSPCLDGLKAERLSAALRDDDDLATHLEDDIGAQRELLLQVGFCFQEVEPSRREVFDGDGIFGAQTVLVPDT